MEEQKAIFLSLRPQLEAPQIQNQASRNNLAANCGQAFEQSDASLSPESSCAGRDCCRRHRLLKVRVGQHSSPNQPVLFSELPRTLALSLGPTALAFTVRACQEQSGREPQFGDVVKAAGPDRMSAEKPDPTHWEGDWMLEFLP